MIDAGALKKRFKLRINWLKKDVHDQYTLGLLHGCEYDMKLIDEIPTVDAEPVKHGRWEWFCDKESLKEYGSDGLWGYRCSLCEAYADDYGYDSKHPDDTDETPEEHLPYCPRCGAKMDLEDDT